MTTPRCDRCKHWAPDADNDWEADAAGFRQCLAMRERWDITDEAIENLEWNDEPASKFMAVRRDALIKARAYVQDGSQYKAEMLTRPDFFCALFDNDTCGNG